jgi:membrane protein
MIVGTLREAGKGFAEDQAAQMGAALAYYTLFSLAPLLMIAISVIGALYGEAETRENLVVQLRQQVDKETADAVGAMLESLASKHAKASMSIVGIVTLLFGATGMFSSLRSSLHRIWRLKPREENFVVALMRTYLLGLLMVFVTCAFLIVLLLVSAAMPMLYSTWAAILPGIHWIAPMLDFLASILLLTLLFVFTYRFLSDGRLRYTRLFGGAFTSAVLFTVGKMGIGYYLALVNLASAFGAAGSLVVFLAWVYYSAQIIFFGAEVVRAALPAIRETV